MPTSKRATFFAPLALLACSPDRADERAAEARVERTATAPKAERVPCAHAGEPLAPTCTVDRDATDAGLTLRHPDGAFRRLTVATDGRGVVAADGAEPARVTVLDGTSIEVAVGADRYRLPATVRATPARP